MKKLKAGMIGCGFIANGKHLPNLARINDVEIVAFCDPAIEKARMAAIKFGSPDALVCVDYQDVLACTDIDFVHICAPNCLHHEMTVAALNSNKHVMCEKPMAMTSGEARAMLEASRRTGKLLTVSYQNRFREDALFMKSLCDKGELGEIYFAKAFATRRRGVPTWGVFLDKEKQGGGPLIDLATHALDLTLWMMNNYEPVVVLGSTYDKIGKMGSSANIMGPWDPDKYEVEDSAFGMVKFKNGASVMVEASWALNTIVSNEGMTLLCGTKAGADMFPPSGLVVCTSDFQSSGNYHVRVNGERNGKLYIENHTMGPGYIDEQGKKEEFAGGAKEMQAWINAVRGQSELVVKPEQAYIVTCILEAIYQSALSGDVVHIQ
jgi:predicted dehydrogenase